MFLRNGQRFVACAANLTTACNTLFQMIELWGRISSNVFISTQYVNITITCNKLKHYLFVWPSVENGNEN